MAKKNQQILDKYLDAISCLKASPEQWPQGYANELIRDLLKTGQSQLQDEFFELLDKQRRKRQSGSQKKDGSQDR